MSREIKSIELVSKQAVLDYMKKEASDYCGGHNFVYAHRKTETGSNVIRIVCKNCKHTIDINLLDGVKM
jgi:tRNA U38,U39,U40 pseudouridine synthase TruA